MSDHPLIPRLGLAVALLLAPAPRAGAEEPPPNLVLISLDTTRADALSCYGQVPGLTTPRPEVTPNVDRLAAEGARFEQFFAHAPTTLNSHASMLTGLDPHQHAIPRNGFPLREGVPTLATRLSDAGWDTVAVVAAAALEEPMGLDRGFRFYDDRFGFQLGPMVQDRASGVLRRALEAVDAREPDEPLFLFVHFFDPHQPYDPPQPWRSRFEDPDYGGPYRGEVGHLGELRRALAEGRADPADLDQVAALYLAEVAYVDAMVGALLESLRARGLLDHAVVVVTADHGEVLSELPPFAYTHGTDVSDGVMRVPLVVRGYGVPLAEHAVVTRQVGMAGLAPTLEEILGLEPTLGRAASFAPLLSPGPVRDEDGWPEHPTRPVVMEATRPHRDDIAPRWNNLDLWRGLRAGGFVVRSAPRSGLDATLDGAPGRAPTWADRPVRDILARLLAAWDEATPPFRTEVLTSETRKALEALGYLDDDP